MEGQNESSPMWIAGIGLVGFTLVYVWIIGDPMLVYLLLVTAVMAMFPTYKQITALLSLLGMFRIALRHDVIAGDFSSFILSVGEGLDITVGGVAAVVTLMAMVPALRALFAFDVRAATEGIRPAVPLLTLVLTRYFIERRADTDLTKLAGLAMQHARDAMKILRTVTGMVR